MLFRLSSKIQMLFIFYFFRFFFFRSEQQLSASTDLEQPRNANVIEKNTWQTKCRLNISCGFLRFAIYHRVKRVHIPFMVYSRHKDSITRLKHRWCEIQLIARAGTEASFMLMRRSIRRSRTAAKRKCYWEEYVTNQMSLKYQLWFLEVCYIPSRQACAYPFHGVLET